MSILTRVQQSDIVESIEDELDICRRLSDTAPSRALSLTITKLEEALHRAHEIPFE